MEICRAQNLTAPTPALALAGANETWVFTQNEPKCTQFAPLRGALLCTVRESEGSKKSNDCVFLYIRNFQKNGRGLYFASSWKRMHGALSQVGFYILYTFVYFQQETSWK